MSELEANTEEGYYKDFEQNMITYRYLADLNVKYMMFFIILGSFAAKVYFDGSQHNFFLLLLVVGVGFYVAYSIFLVRKRMENVSSNVEELTTLLSLKTQNFEPFMRFLLLTIAIVLFGTVVLALGMSCHEFDGTK